METGMDSSPPLRVLSIDGGGMRGLYSATYLSALAAEAAKRRGVKELDVGKAFDLIVGTSTGGIIACALAAGISLKRVAAVYRQRGKAVFPVKMPDRFGLNLFCQIFSRPRHLAAGAKALTQSLEEVFGNMTVRDVYDSRRIALAIPAVEMGRHRARVFKTPHLNGHRDDDFRLVDVCLATSAAPLYRSLARVPNPIPAGGHCYTFADGGLWANNPVLVAMIDAFRMTKSGARIDVFSLGTCSPPVGDINIPDSEINWGLREWKFGAEAAALSIDAQQSAYDDIARMLVNHVDRECRIVRFPHGDIPTSAAPYLSLDETREKGMQVLMDQAHADVSHALSAWDGAAKDGEQMLAGLLASLPPAEEQNGPCERKQPR